MRPGGGNAVAIHLWVLAGTADEGADEHGCAHLLEHMLFKPIELDGKRHDIAAAIETLGGDVNAFTSHDETVFHATVPVARFEQALHALVQPIARARPVRGDLEQEAQVVLEEIKQYDDDPASRVVQEMVEGLFGRHGYARPVLGRAPEVAAHRVGVLRRFLARNYGGERLALVIVGPVEVPRAIAAAKRALRGFSTRTRSRTRATPALPRTAHVVVRRDDVHEAHIALGWQAPAWPDDAACELELAATILGYGESSWLLGELRRTRGLVSDAHASLYASALASTFTITAHAPPPKVESALAAILDEVARMGATAADAQAHGRAKAVLESEAVYRRETVNGLAHALGYYLSLGDDVNLDRAYAERIAKSTPATVRDAVGRWLVPAKASLAIVVPNGWSAARVRALVRRAKALLGPARKGTRRRAPRIDRHGIAVARLDCGLELRVVSDSSLAMAAGWMVWPGGQRAETPALAGATALATALLTRGTATIDGDELAREIEGRAAVLDGMSGRNSAALHFECLSRDRELLVRRMFECATVPSFAPTELKRERRLALEDLAADRDDLAGLAFAAAAARLYGAHPYGRRRRGTRETLTGLDAPTLRRYWASRYPLGRACLAVCGDVDSRDILELVEQLCADIEPPRGAAPWPGPAPKLADDRIARLRRRREQAHLVLGWPGIDLTDPRVPAMEVLIAILSAQAGRLFVATREEEGLVYHVSASSTEGIDAGHVNFYAATSQDKLARVRQVLERERERLCREAPSSVEVERAAALLVGQADAAMQRRGRVASLMAFNTTYGLGHAAHLGYERRILDVRPRDVLALAREVLRPDRQVTSIVSS
jgi:zinc protease